MKTNLYKNRINFFTNIVLPSILAVVLFIVTLFYIVIPHFENAMMDRKREMITELTNAATSILEKYHKDEQEGLLTREEAQNTAISRIKYLRYGEENKDYFWITDMEPIMIVHPYRPELDGQNLENYLDSHGKKLFVEFVKTVENNNHGYVEYMWQWKDDPTHIVPKLSYVKGFEPWGWIVGTGIYIEDVKSEIAVLSKTFTRISIIISLIIALILFWVSRQSFKIEKKRRIAEEELNESREKYRTLVEASTEGLLMYMDKQISFVNPVFEKMSDLSADEIFRKKITEIIEIPEEIKNKIENEQFDFNQISIESTIYKKNNEKLDVILNVLPINFYGKDAIIFSVKDISSDKQIKEELFYNKEKFQTLMDKLNQGIFRTSVDLKGKILEANNTALRILGYNSFSEMENRYILDYFVEEEDKKTFRKKLLEKGFVNNQIIKLRKKNGEQILATVSLMVIYDSGEPKFCDGIIKDVTLQKAQECQTDTVSQNFTSFSQLFYQPVGNLGKPLLICDLDTSLQDLSKKMTENSTDFALIKANSGEIIGYINDVIIRTRTISEENCSKIKSYQFMSSPVPVIKENSMVLDALNTFKTKHTDFLVIQNNNNEYTAYINKKDILILQDFIPVSLINNIEKSDSVNELKEIREQFVLNLIPVINHNTHSSIIFQNLSMIADLLCKKIISLTIDEIGEPPAPFTFLSLGSEGRQEQTLKTDQDNALIYINPDKKPEKELKTYFDEFSNKVCTYLDKIGYNFCTGDVMAMNSDWCQPLSVWKKYFDKWINNGKAQDLLNISIFFDFRLVYGDENITSELEKYINELTNKNPAYLYLLAQNAQTQKPQVGFWGNILLETAGSPPETVDIKKAIMPIVSFARIYALKHNLTELNTIERLEILHDKEILKYAIYKDISQAFNYLAIIRLQHQTSLIGKNANPDNLINTKMLSDLDKTILKKVLSYINNMLSILNYDFKGE